jgi:DNA-binding response OmpR family regulator
MCLAKILVVDDDKNLLEIIKMRLESASYEAVTAHNAEEALSAATEQLFDLAVIDLQLANQDHTHRLWKHRKRGAGHKKGRHQLSHKAL